MRSVSTDPNRQDETVPPDTAGDSGEHATASPSASPAQIYDEALIRLAVITEEWRKGRDAQLSGEPARPRVLGHLEGRA